MSVYSAAITLFLVLDPLGNIPVFLSVLEHVDPARRRKIIIREMVIALGILAAFLLFGKFILRGMHISQPALSIGGGIVLFLIAIRMIFPRRGGEGGSDAGDSDDEPLIVPLAIPLVAGPSAMATLILLATQYPDRTGEWMIALVVAWFASALVLTSADLLRRALGRRGLAALERLMGMILTTMAVQMLLSGIELFVAQSLSGAL
ncbi:MAG: YhgN family NAAT transporter [Alkalispirochaeta sp.]